jgi:hypothetical protein
MRGTFEFIFIFRSVPLSNDLLKIKKFMQFMQFTLYDYLRDKFKFIFIFRSMPLSTARQTTAISHYIMRINVLLQSMFINSPHVMKYLRTIARRCIIL